tara:strand:- start:2062 stop:2283 length:222 start_codon:yes stop_codon:yes gene_type:complete
MYLENLIDAQYDYVKNRAEWDKTTSVLNLNKKYRKRHTPRGKAFRKLEKRELRVQAEHSIRAIDEAFEKSLAR